MDNFFSKTSRNITISEAMIHVLDNSFAFYSASTISKLTL